VNLAQRGKVCIQWSESLTRILSPIPRHHLSLVQIQSSWCRSSRQHLPWGLVPFGEIGSGDRSHAGLPHQHHPFSEFLTLSTVSSHLNFVVLFHTTSANRILGLQSVSLSVSRDTFRRPILSCCWTSSGTPRETREVPLPPSSTASSIPNSSRYPSRLLLRYLKARAPLHPHYPYGKPHWQCWREAEQNQEGIDAQRPLDSVHPSSVLPHRIISDIIRAAHVANHTSGTGERPETPERH
jgi:hypothetical protein